jgi:hypothetical protein
VIPLERLAAHALGDLDDRESAAVDEHILECSECAAKLERLLLMGDAVRELVRHGHVRTGVTPSMLSRLQREGLVTRTYHVARGGSVACSVAVDDVYILVELEADLANVTRVDFVKRRDEHRVRLRDLPKDRARGVVTFVMRGDELRKFPSGTDEVTLLAIEGDGERTLGTYVFEHTAT